MKIIFSACILMLSARTFAQTKPMAQTKPATTTSTTKPTATVTAAKPAATTPAKPKAAEYADLDLSTANPPLPVILRAPKGATTGYDNGVVIWGADSSYGVMIDMSYSGSPASIVERKKDAKENVIFPLEKFIIDKPDLLLYSVKYRNRSEYHFEIAVPAKGETFFLHDKWEEGHTFTQKQIEAMVESAKSLHAK
jgi:hypothetical protein